MIVRWHYSLEHILELAELGLARAELPAGDEVYRVKICDSQRVRLFLENPNCAFCDRKGAYFLLESHLPDQNPHLNLYSDDHVLMTKDHIMPKSKGGKNHMRNYQTLCYECNRTREI